MLKVQNKTRKDYEDETGTYTSIFTIGENALLVPTFWAYLQFGP